MDDLGSDRLTWRDLRAIVNQSIALERPESAIFRAVGGETVDWPLDTHLLAGIYEYARWLVWSQTEAARQPGAKPPEPLPRPGETAEDTSPKHTIEEVKAHLARLNPNHHPGG